MSAEEILTLILWSIVPLALWFAFGAPERVLASLKNRGDRRRTRAFMRAQDEQFGRLSPAERNWAFLVGPELPSLCPDFGHVYIDMPDGIACLYCDLEIRPQTPEERERRLNEKLREESYDEVMARRTNRRLKADPRSRPTCGNCHAICTDQSSAPVQRVCSGYCNH